MPSEHLIYLLKFSSLNNKPFFLTEFICLPVNIRPLLNGRPKGYLWRLLPNHVCIIIYAQDPCIFCTRGE